MMNVMEWIIGRDVTRRWLANSIFPLVVDLDRGSLCGVQEDKPIEHLSALGRAENREMAHSGNLLYYSKGLWVYETERLLSSFEVFFNSKEFSPFLGEIRYGGQAMLLHKDTTADQVKALLGTPDEESVEDGETELCYSPNDNVYFVVNFNEAGKLHSIDFV